MQTEVADTFQAMKAIPATGGHCGEVVDACWGTHNCLFTASTDRTVRVTVLNATTNLWYELARSQVHGHAFSALAVIPPPSGQPWDIRYASASEEKVIRIFRAPTDFVQSLVRLQGLVAPKSSTNVFAARLSPLGLSNKTLESGEEEGSLKPALDGQVDEIPQAPESPLSQILEV